MISEINASDADFLMVALGAKKGQSWLRRNHGRFNTSKGAPRRDDEFLRRHYNAGAAVFSTTRP